MTITTYTKCPKITVEWAEQLLLDASTNPLSVNPHLPEPFGIDWDDLRVVFVSLEMHSLYKAIRLKNGAFNYSITRYIEYDEDIIRPFPVYDPINHEVHLIGFGVNTQTLVVWQ